MATNYRIVCEGVFLGVFRNRLSVRKNKISRSSDSLISFRLTLSFPRSQPAQPCSCKVLLRRALARRSKSKEADVRSFKFRPFRGRTGGEMAIALHAKEMPSRTCVARVDGVASGGVQLLRFNSARPPACQAHIPKLFLFFTTTVTHWNQQTHENGPHLALL